MTDDPAVNPQPPSNNSEVYPVFLKLRGRRVLVVGGGQVAASKLKALIAAQAAITVVAPQILSEIQALGVRCVRRAFRKQDLDGVWYVVSAAPAGINRQVEREARKRRVFVNAVDDSNCASCYLGGVVRKGGVTLAISTEGRSPALTALLRQALAELIPDDVERWLAVAAEQRPIWRNQHTPFEQRRPLLLHVLNEIYAVPVAPTPSAR